MTLIHRFQHFNIHAIFATLWAVVLLTHFNPVDKRLMQGNPANNAPRPPIVRLWDKSTILGRPHFSACMYVHCEIE